MLITIAITSDGRGVKRFCGGIVSILLIGPRFVNKIRSGVGIPIIITIATQGLDGLPDLIDPGCLVMILWRNGFPHRSDEAVDVPGTPQTNRPTPVGIYCIDVLHLC